MNLIPELTIYDEDGFIAIANADKYKAFVDEDWQLDQLMNHFVEEMNNDNTVVWETVPGGGEWKVKFFEAPSDNSAHRQFDKTIEVTGEELYLTNYTDLTMAAQYTDEKIPAEGNSGLNIKIPKGRYEFTIRQMFDPGNFDYESGDNCFEVIIKQSTNKTGKIDKVFWITE